MLVGRISGKLGQGMGQIVAKRKWNNDVKVKREGEGIQRGFSPTLCFGRLSADGSGQSVSVNITYNSESDFKKKRKRKKSIGPHMLVRMNTVVSVIQLLLDIDRSHLL